MHTLCCQLPNFEKWMERAILKEDGGRRKRCGTKKPPKNGSTTLVPDNYDHLLSIWLFLYYINFSLELNRFYFSSVQFA